MPGRVTISDVAREAGVSMMTVSRVINDKGEISRATRDRVLEVVERLGYRPSSIARGLATRRTGTLGLVVPDIANPFFSDLVCGAEDKAYSEGYSAFVCNSYENPRREFDILELLEEKRVDGVLFCSSRMADVDLRRALEQHDHAVLVNRRLDRHDVGMVLLADEAAAAVAMQHLLGRGHRAIGFLSGPSTSYSGHQRARGYLAALEHAGLVPRPEWMRPCTTEVEGGWEMARELLADHPELTALFCYNDLVAVGAMQACAELGRTVPDDLAIVGFDDIPLAALVTPALTTCRVPRYEMGERAMQLLLDRIEGCTTECEQIVLQPELVVRGSAP